MTAWKGGRGVKAPYETTHVRIPVAIKEEVEALSRAFKEGHSVESKEFTSLEEAIEICQKIIKQKKSARVSLENLLTALYKQEVHL